MIIRQATRICAMTLRPQARPARPSHHHHRVPNLQSSLGIPFQAFSSKSSADEKIEEIQELYATAKDEFEIATEETDKKTVYAADDRETASEELKKLQEAYQEAVKGAGGEEIQKRVGQRIRELESAMEALFERAKQD